MAAASITEKVGVAISVMTGGNAMGHAGLFQPVQDKGGQIEEQPVGFGLVREELVVRRILVQERDRKFRADFVGGRADARSYRGGNVCGLCAPFDHRVNRCADNAIERAAPSGMGGTDDARLGIHHQDGGTIRGEDANRYAGGRTYQGVGFRRAVCPVDVRVNDRRGMGLLAGSHPVSRASDDLGGAGAIFTDMSGVVIGPEAAIQTGVNSLAYAVGTGQEPVLNTENFAQGFCADVPGRHRLCVRLEPGEVRHT